MDESSANGAADKEPEPNDEVYDASQNSSAQKSQNEADDTLEEKRAH